MENINGFVLLLLLSVFISLLIIMIQFFKRFNDETCDITFKMQHASDMDEYYYWSKKLSRHYLRLIPFVKEKHSKWYRNQKQSLPEKRSDGLYHILAPSLLSVVVCAMCLCGSSLAWFSASQTSNIANIVSATYTVEVTAKKAGNLVNVTKSTDTYKIALESGGEYEITILAKGTANNGYCAIEFIENNGVRTVTENLQSESNSVLYYTPQIEKGNSFTFKVKANSDGELKITQQWGTCSLTDHKIDSEAVLVLGTKAENNVIDNKEDNDEKTNNALTTAPQITPNTSTSPSDNESKPADTTSNDKTTTLPSNTTETTDSTNTDSKSQQITENDETVDSDNTGK